MARVLVEGLRGLGHQLAPTPDSCVDFGSGQFSWRLLDDADDGYAASDSRREGQAAGF